MPFVILLFALFASLFTFSKDTLNFAEPFFLIGSRMTFAGILLVCHQLFISKNKVNFKAKHVKPLALLSIFAIYLTNITEIIPVLTNFEVIGSTNIRDDIYIMTTSTTGLPGGDGQIWKAIYDFSIIAAVLGHRCEFLGKYKLVDAPSGVAQLRLKMYDK